MFAAAAAGADKPGHALRLDGKTPYGARHCTALDLQDAVTMEAWIKPGRFPGASARIIDKDDDAYMLDTWPAGSVKGLRARGGFEVDIAWKAGKLTAATIRSKLGRLCTVRRGEKVIRFDTRKGRTYRLDGDLQRE